MICAMCMFMTEFPRLSFESGVFIFRDLVIIYQN